MKGDGGDKVVRLADVRRQRSGERKRGCTRLRGWQPFDVMELAVVVRMDEDGERLVLVDTTGVAPGDHGLALTPLQARSLALALAEVADEADGGRG